MERRYTNRRFLDALEQKILVYDGAMGTSLQALHLTAQDFGPEACAAGVVLAALTGIVFAAKEGRRGRARG